MKILKTGTALTEIRARIAEASGFGIGSITPSILEKMADLVVSKPTYKGAGHSGRTVFARHMPELHKDLWLQATVIDGQCVTLYPLHDGDLGSLFPRTEAEIDRKLSYRGMARA